MTRNDLTVSTTLARHGFRGKFAKYRVAWSLTDTWHPSDDARSREYQAAKAQGLAGVEYASGAGERDSAIARAHLCVATALEAVA